MKRIVKITALVAVVLALAGCKGGNRGQLLPNVSGKAGEIVVVIDKDNWEGEIGNALRGILAEDCPYLAQREPLFNLANVPPGSFIAIGQVFPAEWDWYRFLTLLALLSIMLGVMNLLPIPALDGGHIVICLYEIITGRKPGDKFILVAQMVGMFLLVALMLLAFGNDIGRLIR